MRIGIFDSGIGGLTVLAEAIKKYPQGEFIYFADTGNVPYGTKSKEEVKELVLKAADFLDKKHINALLVACNTATSIGIEELRRKYDYPVIGMEPAVKTALKKDDNKKVLVMATALTLKEDKFRKLVHITGGDSRVEGLPMPGLVLFAEKKNFQGQEVEEYIRNSLSVFDLKEFSTLVLGCTHFIYFKDLIKRVLPDNIDIIDGNEGTVKNLISKLGEDEKEKSDKDKIEYYSSSKDFLKGDFEEYLSYLQKEGSV
ncbi:MAG: glutamate racemase [Eubacteriales bacterium]|nr:glutamate racemase [Eubacteriales bacterium]